MDRTNKLVRLTILTLMLLQAIAFLVLLNSGRPDLALLPVLILAVVVLVYRFRGYWFFPEYWRMRWRVRGHVRQIARLKSRIGHVTQLAAAAEMRSLDPTNSHTPLGHSGRVAELSGSLAQEMGLRPDRVHQLKMAGLLHDVGKSGIPEDILRRDPRALSRKESIQLQGHPEEGSKLLAGMEHFPLLAPVVLQHHERLDGSGYPAGLAGDAILPEARIVAVAEAVDEMSMSVPYGQGLGRDEVAAHLRAGRATLYDPAVVDAYLDLIGDDGGWN
jgi:HD-GYP domain-containing protein (c-di-GMP phosphodiesterase class II)